MNMFHLRPSHLTTWPASCKIPSHHEIVISTKGRFRCARIQSQIPQDCCSVESSVYGIRVIVCPQQPCNHTFKNSSECTLARRNSQENRQTRQNMTKPIYCNKFHCILLEAGAPITMDLEMSILWQKSTSQVQVLHIPHAYATRMQETHLTLPDLGHAQYLSPQFGYALLNSHAKIVCSESYFIWWFYINMIYDLHESICYVCNGTSSSSLSSFMKKGTTVNVPHKSPRSMSSPWCPPHPFKE